MLLKVNKDKIVNQRRYWDGRGNFAGELFDSALRVSLKVFQ